MKKVEKEGYTYLGIVELDKIKGYEMKKKKIKEYKRRLRFVLISKLNMKNKIITIIGREMAIFRYGAGIKWKKSKQKVVDRRSREKNDIVCSVAPEE